MFSTFKTRLLLGIYIFIILSIPVGAYLASEAKVFKSKASEDNSLSIKPTPRPTLSPAKDLLKDLESKVLSQPSANSSAKEADASSSPTIAKSFGPTLSLKATMEGRPANNQATKLFVGIIEGVLSTKPKFLLTFSVDLPADGSFSNLSLAGLSVGSKYTALIKGSAQIANSASFTMSPTVTNLNDGQPISMLSGDLNEDNVINSADFSIVQKANGATAKSTNWNENVDLNKDGVVNIFDLSIVNKNIGQIGASGAWTSPIPKVATPSASLNTPSSNPVGFPQEEFAGYWMWIPK